MRLRTICGATSLLTALVVAGSSSAGSAGKPHNRALPRISGATIAGKTLKAARGRWRNRPTTFRYA
ncbi:MAG TPA: hypothetical protein VH420_05090, partial [Gaiellaceae bacterium]